MPASPLPLKPFFRAAAAVGSVLLAITAPPAAAGVFPSYEPTGAECTLVALPELNEGPALIDPLGYRFDTTPHKTLLGISLPPQYATLADGGAQALPPRRAAYDAYDNWGDLYVGATQSRATQYLDGLALGCSREAGGRQVAFAPVQIGGLRVQRKLFVSQTRGSGVRLVQSVTNPGPKAATTSVFVGDLTNTAGRGTLGSDGGTTLDDTSSGDANLSPDDRWAVTSDGHTAGDPALAHVWDGPGGATRATIVRSGAQADTTVVGDHEALDRDRFGYGWQDVVIAPGETASFLSWEAQRAADSLAEQVGMAEDAAVAASDAPASTTFEAMTAGEIASVRNWAAPEPVVTISPVTAASTDADVTLAASTIDFSPGADLPQCEHGTLTWDFGDGTGAVGPGGAHRFGAGAAEVKVTARNECGGVAKAQIAFNVAVPSPPAPTAVAREISPFVESVSEAPARAPSAPVAAEVGPASAPATTAAAPAPPALTLTAPDAVPVGRLGKSGVATEISSSVPGALRIVLSGGGLKLAKSMTLQPGTPRTPTFKLSARDLSTARKAKSLKVRAKLTLADGHELITSRTILLRK